MAARPAPLQRSSCRKTVRWQQVLFLRVVHGPHPRGPPTARPTRSLPPAGSPGRCHFQCHTGVWGPRLSGESEGRRAASAGPPVAEDGAGAARSAQVLAGRLYVTELTATRRSRFRHVPERS